jgi:hypothetical protein
VLKWTSGTVLKVVLVTPALLMNVVARAPRTATGRPQGSATERVTPKSYTVVTMPSKHPRIAVTADPELGDALERVRSTTGTQEADATLVRRLAVEGARVELQAGRGRREAIEALFAAMDSDGFDLDLDEIDRLNSPPSSV